MKISQRGAKEIASEKNFSFEFCPPPLLEKILYTRLAQNGGGAVTVKPFKIGREAINYHL